MYRSLLLTIICTFAFVGSAFAQGSVNGTVTDFRTGETLPGVNIVINELDRGVATDIEGQFTVDNIPAGSYTLVATYIGYQRYTAEIQVGTTALTHNIELRQDILGLEEVVVTGVGRGTETTKLGFSVSKVSEREISEVPAVDAANAIRGKIAGVTIVQASGDPAAPADIRLRGSTSISGSQSPLIIVDGVITDGNLRDINMNDVESIEVVKGAAAASIYGSLAGNGVIQIITKRAGDQIDRPQFTVRSEYGFSEIAEDYPVATKHPYDTSDLVLTNDGVNPDPNGRYILSWPSAASGNYTAERRFDQDYPFVYDNIDAVFTSQPYTDLSFSLANAGEHYNYRLSFNNYVQNGVMDPLDPYERNTARFNADFVPGEKLRAAVNVSYTNITAPYVPEQGQSGSYFYNVLTAEPVFNFAEQDEEGNYVNNPIGYDAMGSNFTNPLYVASTREYLFDRDRIIAGLSLDYELFDFLSAHGRYSLDKSYTSDSQFYPKGYITPSPSQLTEGYDWRRRDQRSTTISEVWLNFNEDYQDFNVNAILKYLYEDRTFDRVSLSGRNYPVAGIRNIGSTQSDSHNIGSYESIIRAENFFLNLDLDYQDKIILSGLVRRDGSSGFGSDERWQTYYRGSLTYRITEDFQIDNINEWKVRASYGTSGQRPPFQAQYETFNATASGISPGILGNTEIKASTVAELEVGTNLTFLDRYNFEANYSITNVQDDYLLVPLSSVAGFSAQYQNVGEIESTSLEFALSGQIMSTRDFTWDASLTWSKVTQEVTSLGNAPAFTRSAGGAIPLFRFEAGVPYGTMYGNVAVTSIDQLTVVNGVVLNAGNGLTLDDFEVNQHGYVVQAGTHGTPDEQILYVVDEDGNKVTESIGNTNPDFTAGMTNTLNYKGIGLYVMLDWVQGGDVYNYSKQLLYFNNRHMDQQRFAEQGFDVGYTDGGSAIYNAAQPSSYFVEDASYLKLREVALSYTMNQAMLNRLGIGNAIRGLKFSVTGRNLLTFTNYSGWDPEVALRTNSTNFRLDEYAYPNYRTYTGSIEIRF